MEKEWRTWILTLSAFCHDGPCHGRGHGHHHGHHHGQGNGNGTFDCVHESEPFQQRGREEEEEGKEGGVEELKLKYW